MSVFRKYWLTILWLVLLRLSTSSPTECASITIGSDANTFKSIDFVTLAASAWEPLISEPDCSQILTVEQLKSLQATTTSQAIKGLEDFWHTLTCVLPGHVSQKRLNETISTMGQLSRQGSSVIYDMTSCQPIFYAPDLVHVESYARDHLAIKVIHIVWSGITSWFRSRWAPLNSRFSGSDLLSAVRLGAAVNQDLSKLYLVTRCQRSIRELGPRLSCPRLEYETQLAAVRRVHQLLAKFFSDTNLDGDTVVDGPWGRRNEVIIRGLCSKLLMAVGYEELEGYQWCTTAPACAG